MLARACLAYAYSCAPGGPLSERIGRRPVFLISIFAYTIWNVACALAHNTPSILVFRFLGGVFGAAPLTTSGGTIADVWDAKRRGIALSLFSVAPFAGPALGPIVSGAISVTGTSWRWVYWVCAMFSGACFVIVFATMKETYAPVILKRKAQRIRKETGSSIYVAPLELTPLHAKTLLHDTLLFPFAMLLREPILAAMALYLGFVYGLIYLQFEAFPIVSGRCGRCSLRLRSHPRQIFQTPQPQGYGYNGLLGGVCFLSLFTGGVIGCIFYVVFFNPRYVRLVDEYAAKGQRVP
jgi:multidrug resistance protein